MLGISGEVHLNVAGLNHPIKRQKLKVLLKKLKCDVFCAHETHFRKQEGCCFKEIFFWSFNSCSYYS